MVDEACRDELPAWVREDRPLDEAGWLADFRLIFVLDYVDQQDHNRRRIRLFACACCRRAWELLRWESARRIVELSEAYADGEVSTVELQAAYDHPDFAGLDAQYLGEAEAGTQLSRREIDAIAVAQYLARVDGYNLSSYVVAQDTSGCLSSDYIPGDESDGPGRGVLTSDAEIAEKEKLLRDIFGNPFRPVAFAPAWRTSDAMSLARGMYKSRDFSAMPILADALQDAGCDNDDILAHCRGPGPHVRGCWVVDLVLGKE